MKYVILLDISQVGHDDGVLHADAIAQGVSAANPTRLVRIINTHDDSIVATYRNGKAQEQ